MPHWQPYSVRIQARWGGGAARCLSQYVFLGLKMCDWVVKPLALAASHTSQHLFRVLAVTAAVWYSCEEAVCCCSPLCGPREPVCLRVRLLADPSQPPQLKTPAEAAGVAIGDVLVAISDTLVAYMTYEDMAEVLSKAQRPAKFVFARHKSPFNPDSARAENIILKQVRRAPCAPCVTMCSGGMFPLCALLRMVCVCVRGCLGGFFVCRAVCLCICVCGLCLCLNV